MDTTLRSAVWVPLFDELADPLAVARLAARAEEVGWHGFFVWDHVNWRAPITSVADPWITLAAIATATESLTFGPMVTPLARRRPVKVARETATLDRLSGGRLVLGAGLGEDRFGNEFSKTGDELDALLPRQPGIARAGRPRRGRAPQPARKPRSDRAIRHRRGVPWR
jgi:alkanesulfonate monooxygenase SsuD/methylene tetrahydromethanopterin reductase-like flavin-dependent oxidoreductase (luciferase family)